MFGWVLMKPTALEWFWNSLSRLPAIQKQRCLMMRYDFTLYRALLDDHCFAVHCTGYSIKVYSNCRRTRRNSLSTHFGTRRADGSDIFCFNSWSKLFYRSKRSATWTREANWERIYYYSSLNWFCPIDRWRSRFVIHTWMSMSIRHSCAKAGSICLYDT